MVCFSRCFFPKAARCSISAAPQGPCCAGLVKRGARVRDRSQSAGRRRTAKAGVKIIANDLFAPNPSASHAGEFDVVAAIAPYAKGSAAESRGLNEAATAARTSRFCEDLVP